MNDALQNSFFSVISCNTVKVNKQNRLDDAMSIVNKRDHLKINLQDAIAGKRDKPLNYSPLKSFYNIMDERQ